MFFKKQSKQKLRSGGFVTVVLQKRVKDNPEFVAHVRGTNYLYFVPQYEDHILCYQKKNLLTNGGRDWMHAQVYSNTSAGTRGSGYVALSEETTNPAAGDTTLASEITTNGLARTDAATKSHTNGTNSTVIEHTHTASGSFTDVVKSGLFNASSGGTLTHAAKYATGSGTMISGDTLKTTWTLNLG